MVPILLKEGHKIIAVDNFMYSQSSLLDCCHDKKLSIIRGDARQKELISKCLKDVDAVFPLACITGAPACNNDPVTATTTNFDAIKMMLELRSKKQLIIFPTTNSGYGVGQEGIYCTEKTPLNPISLYGRLKVDAALPCAWPRYSGSVPACGWTCW
jgi:nucleoside-diphosphate-sugar epimerase